MIRPSVEELAAAAGQGAVVPVWREIVADVLTPVLAFRSVANADHSYLLESLVGGEKWARYSFVGIEPEVVFRSRGRRIEIERRGRTEIQESDDPLETIGALLAEYRPVHDPELPRFWGGAVGYLGYDLARFTERLPERHAPDLRSFDSILVLGGTVLVFDNLRQTLKVVTSVRIADPGDAERLHDEARGRIASTVGKLRRPPRLAQIEVPMATAAPRQWPTPVTPEPFAEAAQRAREAIHSGEVTQIALSRRWEVPRTRAEPFEIYRTLRVLSPSPYMFYLGFPEGAVFGASPEVLVRLESGVVELPPIAGTRWHHRDAAEVHVPEANLIADEGEWAEPVERVDLAGNDIARIANPGDVEASGHAEVEKRSNTVHRLSSVRARLAPNQKAVDVLRVVLPARTLSGTPKARAMELIDTLESTRRGIYGGAVGYIGFDGNMDLCVAARGVVERADRYLVQAGAGIHGDSTPEREESAIRDEAAILLAAIDSAGRPETA